MKEEEKQSNKRKRKDKEKEQESLGKTVFDRVVNQPSEYSKITPSDIELLRRYKKHSWNKGTKKVSEKRVELASAFPFDFQIDIPPPVSTLQPV